MDNNQQDVLPTPVVEAALPKKDIHFRGFLTYRGLRFWAMVMMTLSQTGIILTFFNNFTAIYGEQMLSERAAVFWSFMSSFNQISFPLLMIASVGVILNHQESFRKMLINYFIMAVIIYLGTVFILGQTIMAQMADTDSLLPQLQHLYETIQDGGFLKGFLVKTVLLIIPGDGVIHLEKVNELLAFFGASVRVTDLDSLINLVPEMILTHSDMRDLIDLIACCDLTGPVSAAADVIQSVLNSLEPDVLQTALDFVLPRITTFLFLRLNFNIFLNLFLYTAILCFITWEPAGLSAGKKMLFHCCAVIPGGWLVLSWLISTGLRTYGSSGFVITPWFVALLSNVPLSSLLVFFLLMIFVSYQKLEYTGQMKNGYDWNAYSTSRLGSLHFSCVCSIILIVVSLIDFALGHIAGLSSLNIGSSGRLWQGIPFLMLYSFNKEPRHKALDVVVPIYTVLQYLFLVALGGGMVFYLLTLFFEAA